MVTRVLVTRPQPGADRTAGELRRRGFEAIVVPLTETVPVDLPRKLLDADVVAASSANALRHASPDVLDRLKTLPGFAVGERTAAAMRKAGFVTVENGGGTAQALAETIIRRTAAQSRVAYLCGRLRKADLEIALTSSGRSVIALETYATNRLPVTPLPGSVDVVLLYSAEAADALVAARALMQSLAGARFLCLSQAVAQALPTGLDTGVAASPDEAALLALLADAKR